MEDQEQNDEAVTFDDLHVDCLVHVLSFLDVEQMNDLVTLNSTFNEARNRPSLDQSRTATLTIINRITDRNLYRRIESQGWAHAFTEGSKFNHLRVIHYERVRHPICINPDPPVNDGNFQSITHLDISKDPSDRRRMVHIRTILLVAKILPNLQHINMNYIHSDFDFFDIVHVAPNLRSLSWRCSRDHRGEIKFTNVTPSSDVLEVNLDCVGIYNAMPPDEKPDENYLHCLWDCFPQLKCLSLKGSRAFLRVGVRGRLPSEPLSQEMLIELVRCHPTLRWLSSDLTNENIAMLNRERPEITLVND